MNDEKKPQRENSEPAEKDTEKIPSVPEKADSEPKEEPQAGKETGGDAPKETADPKVQESPDSEEKADGGQDAEKETAEGETPKPEKKKRSKPPFYTSEKFKHGSTATAFTAIFIVAVILLNVIVGILGDKFPSINVDLTKSGSNTLSDEAKKVVDQVKIPVSIYICATKQQMDSGDNSQVVSLTAKIQERNSKIHVEYKDLDKNPVFASKYTSESLAAGDVIVQSDKRYRVLTGSDLFKTQYSSDYSSSNTYSNVDSSLASALNTVISEALPVAAFDTGHGEKMDSSAYQQILKNNSFETKDFSLLTESIPDKTQLVVLGCPTTDYTDAEITKLEDYLKNTQLAGDRSLMVTFSAGLTDTGAFPKLSAFLQEWGLSAAPSEVVEETSAQNCFGGNPLYLVGNVQTKLSLGGASSSYSNLIVPNACPITIQFSGRNSRSTYSLIQSGSTSFLYKNGDDTKATPKTSAQNLAALCQDTVQSGGKSYHANVIAIGSGSMFSSSYLNANAFSNSSYLVDLSKYATGTSSAATQISTKNNEMYAKDIVMNTATARTLGLGVFTILVPLLVAVAGIVVYRKRRLL